MCKHIIPPFHPNGNLPPGIHLATWREFSDRFGDTSHRRNLLRAALDALALAGCQLVYIDGSFVTAKAIPGDYDACWETTGVNRFDLDPVFLDFANRRAAQKAKYLGEFFPARMVEAGSGAVFLAFFQTDKTTGNSKGIVALELEPP